MKNADMPAMATPDVVYESGLKANGAAGLTKREHFAAMAMQGLVSGGLPPEYAAPRALDFADALLAALERR